jgi:hypothetical protein
MQDAAEFAALTEKKRDLKVELKRTNERLAELEGTLLDAIEREKFPASALVAGMRLYTQNQLWASAVDGDYTGASRALSLAGLGDYVGARFNVQTLSAHFREERKKQPLVDVEEILPAELRGYIKLSETPKLMARAA